MKTLIFPDTPSQRQAAQLVRSLPDAQIIDMVLREADLRTADEHAVSEADYEAVATRSAELSDCLEAAFTGSVEQRLWQCYAEYFRSWAVAPLLSNVTLAQKAIAGCDASELQIRVLEKARSGGWLACRQQVFEAVQAALSGTKIPLKSSPSASLRFVRNSLLHLGAPWLMGFVARLQERSREANWYATLPQLSQADVLFLPIGNTCVPIIDRLVPGLQQEELSSVAMLLHPEDKGIEKRAQTDVLYQYIDNFQPPPLASALTAMLAWPEWFIRCMRELSRQKPGALWSGLRNRLLISLARDMQQTLADVDAAKQILDTCQPRLIVAFHLYWHRLAPLILLARERNIPMVYLQHGIYLARDECIRPLPFDEFLTFGETAAESIQSRLGAGKLAINLADCVPGPVTAVGHCLYDDLGNTEPITEADLLKLRGNASGIVLVATQPDELQVSDVDAPDWWLRKVGEACEQLGLRAILKLHPAEVEIGHYENLAAQMPEAMMVLPHGIYPLPSLLAVSKALVTRDSTVVIEAGLLGIPALTINLTGRKDRFSFEADGGAVTARKPEEILPLLKKIAVDGMPELAQRRAGFLARHCGPGGSATRRVVEAFRRHIK